MQKFVLLFLAICLSSGAHAQLLYRISGNGLEHSSYIVGTYHLAPSTFADSIAGAYTALEQCEQVYGELVFTDMTHPDSVARVQHAMLLPDGMTLSQLLTPDEMSRVKDYASKKLGLAAPMLMAQAERMSPMALSTVFETLIYAMKSGRMDVSDVLDLHFQRYALDHGKGVGGLETLGFQIKTLYQSTPLDRQKQLLLCLVDHPDFAEAMSDMVIDRYFAQDIEGVKAAMDMKMEGECDNTPDEDAALIDGRNTSWAELMPSIMQAKPTFFAVGAAHLPGNQGVLNLLRQAGYTVEGVKVGQ